MTGHPFLRLHLARGEGASASECRTRLAGGIEIVGPLRGPAEDRLRDIESITDAALSHLGDDDFLAALLDRTKEILHADTAAVLLLDYGSGHLIATAAAGRLRAANR